MVASYGLQAFVGKGEVKATHALGASFNQRHVEIFQALMLRKREEEWGQDPPTPDDTPKAAEVRLHVKCSVPARPIAGSAELPDACHPCGALLRSQSA